MTPLGKVLSTRLSVEELEELQELGRRLGTNDTDTIKLALHALKKETGLLKLDSIALTERIARQEGDDVKVKFKLRDVGVEALELEVTVNGKPVPDFEAYALPVTLKRRGQVIPATNASAVGKDLQTGLYYSVGMMPLTKGAIIEVPLSKLPDLLQSDDGLTPEQRREHIRKNAQIRRAVRVAHGEPEDEEGLPLDD